MDHTPPIPAQPGPAPPEDRPALDTDLERAARALLDAVLAASPIGVDALADLTHRAALLQAAVLHRHPPPVAGVAAADAGYGSDSDLVAEHEELAGAAAELTQALAAWWGAAAKGNGTAWTAGRRAAVAAAQALHDDLRVHHAHEHPG